MKKYDIDFFEQWWQSRRHHLPPTNQNGLAEECFRAGYIKCLELTLRDANEINALRLEQQNERALEQLGVFGEAIRNNFPK